MASTKRPGKRSRRISEMLSSRSGRSFFEEESRDLPCVSEGQGFLSYLIASKGGSDFLLETLDRVTLLAGHFWKGNKTYQRISKTMRYALPAFFLTKELLNTYKEYKLSVSQNSLDAYRSKFANLAYYIGVDRSTCDLDREMTSVSFSLGSDVVNWIFSGPKTENFFIKGFFEIDSREKIEDIYALERGNICIPLEYDGSTYAWEFCFSRSGDDLIVFESNIHFLAKDLSKHNNLKSVVFKEFMKHFDIENNVIVISSSGLLSRPRLKDIEEINQFDVNALAGEMIKVLDRGLRRCYVFVGVPGVGKSTILRKLEELDKTKKFPFAYLDESCMNSERSIKETFSTLRNMQPFIAVLEDADSAGLSKKNSKLGTFLNEVDSVNQNINGILIMTINDTSLMHYTVTRPGRSDEIIMVLPPQSNKEAYEVLEAQYKKRASSGDYLKGKPFIKFEDINPEILDTIHTCGYTQADICEILDKSLLIDTEISNENLLRSLSSLSNSKKAIQKFNFKDLDPNSGGGDEYDEDCVVCDEDHTHTEIISVNKKSFKSPE
jgi:hypothetical protein